MSALHPLPPRPLLLPTGQVPAPSQAACRRGGSLVGCAWDRGKYFTDHARCRWAKVREGQWQRDVCRGSDRGMGFSLIRFDCGQAVKHNSYGP